MEKDNVNRINGLRLCVVLNEVERKTETNDVVRETERKRALFHKWVNRLVPYYEMIEMDGRSIPVKVAGYTEAPFAMVEHLDGSIKLHSIEEVLFTDNLAGYAWEDK